MHGHTREPLDARRAHGAAPLVGLRIALGTLRHAWPVLRRLAGTYRRTVLRRSRVVVVVGSYGKTTTTRAIKAALGLPVERAARRSAGGALAVELLRTPPGRRVAVFEVGIDAPGQMAAYAAMLGPDLTVVTAIGHEHLTSMLTVETTRHEKAEMVRALRPAGLAVLRVDDPRVWSMRDETRARKVGFGYGPEAEVRGDSVILDWPRGTTFRVHVGAEQCTVRSRLLGSHMVPSALAAFAVARHLGVPLRDAAARLERLEPTVGRLDPVPLSSGAWILRDDWKGTWDTVDVALQVLAAIPARRRIVVLGDLSELPRSPGDTLRAIGARVAAVADLAVLAAHKKPMQAQAAGAAAAGLPAERIVRAGFDLAAVLPALPADLGAGDVVLLKGSRRQRLGRVALALSGRPVRCWIPSCEVKLDCEMCPMLERGWDR